MALPPVRSVGNSDHVADHNAIVAAIKTRNGYNVKDYGATGDGSTNDTVAIQAALTAAGAGGTVYVPDGTYMVDGFVHTTPIHWRLSPGATLKMRTASAGIDAVVHFQDGSDGSSFYGGTIDGNRSVLSASWAGTADFWCGLIAWDCDDLHWGDVRIVNTVSFGFWVQGYRMMVRNVKVSSCGKGSQIKAVYDSQFDGLSFQNIGNNGLANWQHCNEWRWMTDVVFNNITVSDFNPDSTGLEPGPTALAFEDSFRIYLNNVNIDGFVGSSPTTETWGITLDDMTDMYINNVTVRGYTTALIISSGGGVNIANYDLDGGYVANVNVGVIIRAQGVLDDLVSDENQGRLNTASRDINFTNGRVRRFSTGMLLSGSYINFSNFAVIGSLATGVRIRVSNTNDWFNFLTAQEPRGISLTNGRIMYNGQRGIHNEDLGGQVLVRGVDLRNNGQDATAATGSRTGFTHSTTATSGSSKILDCWLGDNQAGTLTAGASFAPGSTVSNEFTITLPDPQTYEVGQWIKLVNATGAADITAKIVRLYQDTAVVQTTAPATFSDTGNLTALAGTLSSSGVYVTGTGTSFNTAIKGVMYLKANGQYRKVQRVESATALRLETAFSPNLSGHTGQLVLVNVAGIPSQLQSIVGDAGAVAGTLFTQNNDYLGVVTAPFSLGNYTMFAGGSEVVVSTTSAGVALDTAGPATALIGAFPAGWVPSSARAVVHTAVAGTNGTMTLAFYNNSGVSHAAVGTFAAYTKNTKMHGFAATFTPLPSVGGQLRLDITGGADNIPSAGRIWAEALLKVPELNNDLPSVP